jgi:hypothetical protein
MSAFSPAWLALREPADTMARSSRVIDACRRHFAGRESVTVCDLGAGTGASVRAFADILPQRQYWTLVDHDQQNLAAAISALSSWSDEVVMSGERLTLRRGTRQIEINLRAIDFAQDPASCWSNKTELVTASALFDLTSKGWISRFANALSKLEIAVLATLTFDGTIFADPAHPLDTSVAEAFCLHQTRDKGFGPAAGAHAARHLQQSMEKLGYKVVSGSSPWRLQDNTSELFIQTVNGIGDAVRETGQVALVDGWLQARRQDTRLLTIGHQDLFSHRG